MAERLFKSLSHFFSPIVPAPGEKKKRLLFGFSTIAAVLAFIIASVILFFQAGFFFGFFLLTAGGSLGVCVLIYRNQRNLSNIYRIIMLLLGISFVYLLATSGPHGYKAMWIFIFPPAVFYLMDRYEALLYTGIFFLYALIFLLLQDNFPWIVHHDSEFKFIFLCSFFMLATISYALEAGKHLCQPGMGEKQLPLERDENKLIEAKKTSESAIRAKNEFLANMSHELRTPLNHITGFTELIVDQKFGELNETQREYLNDALQSSKYLLALINDILDLKRMETSKLELKVSEININTILESSLTMIRERALDHGIQVTMKNDCVPETIRGDQRKLQQVMYNLLSNATKFTPAGGTVTISAQSVEKYCRRNSRKGGAKILWLAQKPEQIEAPAGMERRPCVEFSVADNGIGIKPADLERIFNRFEQADGSSRKKFQGTGLGLYLSKRYVELHDGRIWAESGGEGQGSVFRFLIPV
jgi:signal transduction histidine kinase